MAISRIKTDGIQDDAVTSPKIGHNPDFDGQYVRVPHGTTAERPGSPAAGYLRFNTTIGTLEQWNTNTNSWAAIDSPPIIASRAYAGSETAVDPAGGETITLTGSNFKAGATVTVGGTTAPSVSIVSSSSITFTTPAKTAGDYDIVVTNTNGLAATLTNGISYNGAPAFTTAAGNVGTLFNSEAMSTITIVAAEPDSGTLAFSITSGALPSGVSLGSANGQLTGTPNPTISANTTFNFTVTATDDESQTNARAFNLIVLRKIYNVPITRSLMLNDNEAQYLNRTPSASNRRTWTWSGWVKRSNIETFRSIFAAQSSSSNRIRITFGTNNELQVYGEYTGGTSNSINLQTNRLFRDPSAWYHIVFVMDTTQATASNRAKMYVNGEQITSFSVSTYPSQNDQLEVNAASAHFIGQKGDSSEYYDGNIADIHFIDGQAKAPTDFANSYNGVWTPQTYTGTYGSNGFRLAFADDSDIGNDTSGNNNDFTPQSMHPDNVRLDSPTTNFAHLNSNDTRGTVTIQNGTYAALGANGTVTGTQSLPSGKWYWECKVINAIAPYIGLRRTGDTRAAYTSGAIAFQVGGNIYSELADLNIDGGVAYSSNAVIGVAYDADNFKVHWSVNGQWYTANAASASTLTISQVAAGTSAYDLSSFIGSSATGNKLIPYFATSTANTELVVNFGQNPTYNGLVSAGTNTDGNGRGLFTYPVPSGFLAVCAENIADDTDIDIRADVRPDDNMKCVTYTGNGTARSITGLGFQPDLVWIKDRVGTYNHQLYDSVRGPTGSLAGLLTNSNAAANDYSAFTSFDSDGFTITGVDGVNKDTRQHVAWCWKAGGATTATNVAAAGAVPTAGSVKIDGANKTDALAGTLAVKELSANTKAGFSIIRWTGDNADRTIAHGLTETPEFFMTKSLSQTRNWEGFHKNTSVGYVLYLNTTIGQNNASSTYFSGGFQDPNTNNSTIQLSSYVTGNNLDMIGYAWHSVAGYSDIGFYIGNNSADGPAVQSGFKPAWLMITKLGSGASDGSSWFILDNARDPINNPNKYLLLANSAAGDGPASAATTTTVHWQSNGFKVINTGSGGLNESGAIYIYMAFAENPLKYGEAV